MKQQKLNKVFKNLEEIEPSPRLESMILTRIGFLRKKETRRKLLYSWLSLSGSFGMFVLAIVEYGNAFLQSDFWSLLKLLSTDAALVLENWNDFAFSLLETFPVVSFAIILIPTFSLLLSFAAYFQSIHLSHRNYI